MSLKVTGARWKILMAAAAVIPVVAYGCTATEAPPPAAPAPMTQADMQKRGEYLVNAMGCNDCHTPWKMGANGPEPDMTLFLSGHPAEPQLPPPPAASGPWIASMSADNTAWAGPWGISYTQNITPDPETGIGNYTEEQFVMTIREGKKQGRGRDILPPMPWPAFKNLSDEDLKSIYQYLRTIKPITNRVPDPVIAPPMK